ncbi:MAG: hypothetical protein ACQESE_03760 [Nanobdellota archaeon]
MPGLSLSQNLEQRIVHVTDDVLRTVGEHIEKELFPGGKRDKVNTKLQRYLGRINTDLLKGDISQQQFLSGVLFHLFPYSLLNLGFSAEHSKFNTILENRYEFIPEMYISSEENPDFASVDSVLTKKYSSQALKTNLPTITMNSYTEKILEGYCQTAVQDLENAFSSGVFDDLSLKLSKAFGHVKVIPQFFPYKNKRLERRYDIITEHVSFYLPIPSEIVE